VAVRPAAQRSHFGRAAAGPRSARTGRRHSGETGKRISGGNAGRYRTERPKGMTQGQTRAAAIRPVRCNSTRSIRQIKNCWNVAYVAYGKLRNLT
jgi:hypothetical protein